MLPVFEPLLPKLRRAVLAVALASVPAVSVHAGPYLLVEVDSGKVLAQSDAGKPWYPASVTKLMTTYLTFRALRARKVEPQTLWTVSENAVAQPPSKMGFKAGTQVTVDNAIKMLQVKSANDIAVVLAEGVSGSVERFIEEMNLTASRLGMSGTRFVNPHGLPDENQVTTARDMAILARAIIQEYPEYELYFRIPALSIGKRMLRNHNRLIDRYPGANGMKTGFICSSGFNVVASASREDKRLIAVVFGAFSAQQRAEDAARLFERGFGKRSLLAPLLDYEVATVDTIENLPGEPADLREEMCNRKRKRPVAESDIEEEEEEEVAADKNGRKRKHSLLVDLPPSMPPIRVYVGAAPKMPEIDTVMRALDDAKVAKEQKAKGAKAAKADKAKTKKPATTAKGARPEKGKKAEGGVKPETTDAPAPASPWGAATANARPAQADATGGPQKPARAEPANAR